MKIRELFENYQRYRGELEADIYMLRDMLEQRIPDPDGDLADLSQLLKHLKGCADFVNDKAIDCRLEHAQRRFKQLSVLEWALRSRPKNERDLLHYLYIDGLTWSDAAERLNLSKTTLFRRRRQVLEEIAKVMNNEPHFYMVFKSELNGTKSGQDGVEM